MPKELGLFYVDLVTVSLYIQHDQFIIVQVTLLTPSDQIPSNFMLSFKRLRLNLLKSMNMLTLKVVIGNQPTRFKKILTTFKHKFVKFNPQIYRNIFVPTVCTLKKKSLSAYSSAFL